MSKSPNRFRFSGLPQEAKAELQTLRQRRPIFNLVLVAFPAGSGSAQPL